MVHSGGCLCGGITFRIAGALAPIQVCHCSQCRKAQGAPFATNVPVDTAALQLNDPEGLLQVYESSPGKERVFCRRCGSPLFSRRTSLPGVVRLRAGLIDEPVRSQLAWHAYLGSKCSWWPVDDALPHFDEGAPG
ncbi:MAG: GFA family protein [Burkholderiales bacterium]|nr:GFA family protein [Burkholderiales bacterium]